MKTDLEAEAWEQLRINAHSLKPQTDYVGVNDLKDVLIAIENAVKSEAYGNLKELYNRAIALHLASEKKLKEYLKIWN
ncbi:hypothetical protein LOK78_09215 [Mangrovimonas sp. AS18]|nr:hypothetical protein [Mangrovimonas futianensis]